MIYTFYSFKGGVGRSMALANIGEAFHLRGLRVVMVDWDLEAPGLEAYFYAPDLERPRYMAARAHAGLIDLLVDYKQAFPEFAERQAGATAREPAMHQSGEGRLAVQRILSNADDLPDFLKELPEPPPSETQTFPEFVTALARKRECDADMARSSLATSPLAPYLQCIHRADADRKNGLFLLSAGARSGDRFGSYAVAVQDFDWSQFYALYEGGAYLKWLREQLKAIADVVLIDSRTGVTEMGGVCTRYMADAVLAFCAPNFQNVDGVVSVMSGVNRDQVLEVRDNRAVDILVVPTRIDDFSESELLGEFQQRFWTTVEEPAMMRAAATSGSSLPDKPGSDLLLPEALRRLDRPQWGLRIPYVPRYNYREQLVIGPGSGTPDPATLGLIEKYLKIVTYLAVLAPEGDRIRKEFGRELAREFPEVQAGLLICRSASTEGDAGQLRDWLKTEGVAVREDFVVEASSQPDIDLARAIVVLLDGTAESPVMRRLVREARRTGRGVTFMIGASARESPLPPWLRNETILRWSEREALLDRLRGRDVVRRVPHMVPASVGVPRQEWTRLREALKQASRVVLCGPPGTGKTVIAAAYGQDDEWDQRDPGGVLWTSGDDLADLDGVYRTFARALVGETLTSTDRTANRATVVRRLDEARTLVVIDDVAPTSDAGVENLREVVELARRGACIVTTRDATLADQIGAVAIPVGELAEDDATAFVASWLPMLREDAGVGALTAAVGRTPLALSKALGIVSDQVRSGTDPRRAVEQVKATVDAGGILALDGADSGPRSIGGAVRSALARLTREERSRLEVLAGLGSVTRSQAAAACGVPVERIDEALAPLRRQSLILHDSRGVLVVPALIAAYFKSGLRSRVAVERRIRSSGDRQTNPDVARATVILAAEQLPPLEDVRPLAERLKDQRYFDLAGQLFARARMLPALDARTALKLAQRHALCIYKDQDRPADRRLDEAFAILDEADPLARTRSQETLGLAGAIAKNRWLLDGQTGHLERSLAYYWRGFERGPENDRGYTAINAAFVLDQLAAQDAAASRISAVVDDESASARRAEATRVREAILEMVAPHESGVESEGRWWFFVTLAEACFGLARFGEAQGWLRKALTLDVHSWEYESTARQLATLAVLQREGGTLSDTQIVEADETLRLLLGNDASALASVRIGKVGLALSGGGFRASLFHIGVLARLAELDVLRHVEVLSCVSGGSIIGAHYYLEVKRLLETKEDQAIGADDYIAIVKRIERDFLAGVQRNVRTRVALNPLVSLKTALLPNYSRTERVGELYEQEIFSRVEGVSGPLWLDKLFIVPSGLDHTFQPKLDNWRRSSKVPMLVLNATTLNTGHNWQFTASWMGESPSAVSSEIDANDLLRRMYYWEAPGRHKSRRLGDAVAASSCVPGLFEPLVLPGLYPARTVQLVDGGVHDNQGIGGLIEQDCNVVLVSDASGHLATQSAPPTEALDVLPRANNILMARVREAEFRGLEARRRSGVLRGLLFLHLKRGLDMARVGWLQAPTVFTPADRGPTTYGVQRDIQEAIANVRTDLDSFSEREAYALMLSGYRMAADQFGASLPRFPVRSTAVQPANSEAGWRFLAVERAMGQQGGYEEAHGTLLKQLVVAKSRAFKVWRLDPGLGLGGLALLVAALGFAAPRIPLDWSAAWTGAGYAGHAVMAALALALLAGVVFRTFGIPKSVTQLVIGLVSAAVGWLAALLHLTIYDPLYLAAGRVTPTSTGQRLATTARSIVGLAVPALVALAILFGVSTWQLQAVEGMRVEARAAARGTDYIHAADVWGRILRLDPSDPEAIAGRAYAYTSLGQGQKALDALSAVPDDAATPTLLKIRAAANTQLSNLRAATLDYDRILQQTPRDTQVLRDRAYARRQLGEFGGALDDYDRALRIEPNPQVLEERNYAAWLQTNQKSGPTVPFTPPGEGVTTSPMPGNVPESSPSPGGVEAVKPRVYIQWSGAAPRSLPELQKRLTLAGFDVPRPEQVQSVPKVTEVRYYHNADAKRAKEVAILVQRYGVAAVTRKIAGNVRPGHVELWVARTPASTQ